MPPPPSLLLPLPVSLLYTHSLPPRGDAGWPGWAVALVASAAAAGAALLCGGGWLLSRDYARRVVKGPRPGRKWPAGKRGGDLGSRKRGGDLGSGKRGDFTPTPWGPAGRGR